MCDVTIGCESKSDCRTDRREQIVNTACVTAAWKWEGGNTGGKATAKHRFPGICKLVAGGGCSSDVTHTPCCGRSVFESRMKDRLPNCSSRRVTHPPLPAQRHAPDKSQIQPLHSASFRMYRHASHYDVSVNDGPNIRLYEYIML